MDQIRLTWPKPYFRLQDTTRGIGGGVRFYPHQETQFHPVANAASATEKLKEETDKIESGSTPAQEAKELINAPPTDSVLESAAENQRRRKFDEEVKKEGAKKKKKSLETLLSELHL